MPTETDDQKNESQTPTAVQANGRLLKTEEISEWIESPVTQHLLRQVNENIQFQFSQRSEFIAFGDPTKSQEVRILCIGTERGLNAVAEVLRTGNFESLELGETDAEQVGDLSGG